MIEVLQLQRDTRPGVYLLLTKYNKKWSGFHYNLFFRCKGWLHPESVKEFWLFSIQFMQWVHESFLEVLCVLWPSTVLFSSEWGFRSIPAYFNRVLNSREEGLFPVMDKSNFLQIFLKRSTSLLIWFETNILEMCLYEVSYIIVQYGNAWQEQPPNYLGYCDKVVHVVTKPATSLSEQFNWTCD